MAASGASLMALFLTRLRPLAEPDPARFDPRLRLEGSSPPLEISHNSCVMAVRLNITAYLNSSSETLFRVKILLAISSASLNSSTGSKGNNLDNADQT